jgi:hypothetical protein
MDKPAFVSLTLDDGLRCQLEQAVPIFDRYGFPATFFLVANTDPIHTDGCSHPDWSKTDWSEKDTTHLGKTAPCENEAPNGGSPNSKACPNVESFAVTGDTCGL